MPLLRFDIVAGRSPDHVRRLLDAAHRAVLAAFKVPTGDRYQIVHQHRDEDLVLEDTGLGFLRTRDRVVVHVTSRRRDRADKEAFYKLLCHELSESCGIASSDVVVTIAVNGDEDWSFGGGRAQFLTGEL